MSESTKATEYFAVRDGGAGVIDLSTRGRILVSGSEAVMFLNGLVTNDMKTLLVNSWMPAVFPNVQGRLLAAVRVIHRADGFLIDTENATRDAVLKLLERFTLAGDFRLADLTENTAQLSIQGAKASEIMAAIFGETVASLGRDTVATIEWQEKQITIIRATHTAEDGFDLFVNATELGTLRDAFIKAGVQPVGDDTVEQLRLEAGIARYGIDMDETNVVTETNLDDAVSFTKGCYIGQEIIARIKYRGHVAKKLAGLILEGEVSLESGAKIFSTDDKEIGRVTSVGFSPRLARTIALGYVKYDYVAPGTGVKVDSSGTRFIASVAELPFIRGSWYPD
ncbi:MAG TPA: glycine cleavage T C-terminal barrel domain-containing protein [Pyrinomonadaceae bacterium]|nr:glycine cleavage T C-terminal barrel domain-containing protein [Pyrinomonadaceae bacterium]